MQPRPVISWGRTGIRAGFIVGSFTIRAIISMALLALACATMAKASKYNRRRRSEW